jgi:hypothetical protein
MAGDWTEWTDDPLDGRSPYVDWWHVAPPAEFGRPEETEPLEWRSFLTFINLQALAMGWLLPGSNGDESTRAARTFPMLGAPYGGFENPLVPVPNHALNPEFAAHFEASKSWLPPAERLPAIPLGSVIVGVIDSGIALGNSRFRHPDGTSRILAAWQQNGARQAPGQQPYLPFGTELYCDDINRLLRQHSAGGNPRGYLHEEEFNRAAGIVDFQRPLGHREAAGRFAHGTHVLDIAAGEEPLPGSDTASRIIAVNLPNRATLNNSGIFLDYFTIFAIRRIADLSDSIWKRSLQEAGRPESSHSGPRGFPVVINLSFGKNAGAKDGTDDFARAVSAINAEREARGYRRVQLVIPVGNHNLEQGNARMELPPGQERDIAFRTLPEDQSCNFVEIWSDEVEQGPEGLPPHPLALAIAPPGDQPAAPKEGRAGTSRRLGEFAKIYCFVHKARTPGKIRFCYLLCLAPSLEQRAGAPPVSPSGRWTIRIANRSSTQRTVFLRAQTDQSILPSGRTGLAPFFEAPDYTLFDEATGALLDSACEKPIASHEAGPVMRILRHDSINATAASPDVVAVAGHRQSDGQPAIYSATGAGTVAATPLSRAMPTISLPTDDGITLPGTLAAGAANGSVVAMRGTSFSAAAATRIIAEVFKSVGTTPVDLDGWFSIRGRAAEAALHPGQKPTPDAAKIGHGRLNSPIRGRVSRLPEG